MEKLKMVGWMFFLVAGLAFADVRFAPIFNDGAVLQCEMPVNVWGKADPCATVTVSFAGQEKETVASDRGEWRVQLDPMPPSSELRELKVSSSIDNRGKGEPGSANAEQRSGNQQSTIGNVVVGEVWLATGQSNMAIPLRVTDGGDKRLAMTLPEIRFVKVPQTAGLPTAKEFTSSDLAWKTFAPPANQEIAAVAFYFAEKLQGAVGRHVGIIQSSFGGTPCEAWTPEWALDEKKELKYLADAIRKGLAAGKTREQWQTETDEFMKFWKARRDWAKEKKGPAPQSVPEPGPDNPWNKQSPTVLYENMIRPLIPYTARGVVWYQGESNAGRPGEYRILFPTMIDAWRKLWERPDWPFFFVQISSYNHPSQDWPGLRAAQTFTRDTIPNTGMALAIDHGEKENIHPAAKQPVGERLARLALADVYGQKVVSRGPAFHGLEKVGSAVRVVFQYSEDGLQASDGKADVPGFEVAGNDGAFHPAQARIVSKNVVELTCPEVQNPVSVRYAWHNWIEPPVTLQNSAGLPAEPFLR